MAEIHTETPLSLRAGLTVLLDVIVYHNINFKVINSAFTLTCNHSLTDFCCFIFWKQHHESQLVKILNVDLNIFISVICLPLVKNTIFIDKRVWLWRIATPGHQRLSINRPMLVYPSSLLLSTSRPHLTTIRSKISLAEWATRVTSRHRTHPYFTIRLRQRRWPLHVLVHWT